MGGGGCLYSINDLLVSLNEFKLLIIFISSDSVSSSLTIYTHNFTSHSITPERFSGHHSLAYKILAVIRVSV